VKLVSNVIVSNVIIESGYSLEGMSRYRNGAMLAASMALPCEDPELRDAYLFIAKTWAELADKIERELQANRRKPDK